MKLINLIVCVVAASILVHLIKSDQLVKDGLQKLTKDHDYLSTLTKRDIRSRIPKELQNEVGKVKQPYHKMVLDCKMFLLKVHSQKEEFYAKEYNSSILNNVMDLVMLHDMQTAELDKMVFDEIYEEHVRNRSKQDSGNQVFRKALVQGGGPVGLYTAVKLFMAGLDVVLVNDRTDHSRNQILILPEAWSVQMMVLLGIQAKSIDILENSKYGKSYVNIGLLEFALRKRWADLQEHVVKLNKIKESVNKAKTTRIELPNPVFEIQNGTAFVEIEFPTKDRPHFAAVLVKSKKVKGTGKISTTVENVDQHDDEDASGNDCCLISLVDSMKKFGEKSFSLKNSFLSAIYNAPFCPIENPEELECEPHRQLQTFDVLVCAGGANDHNCRDPYLGIAHQVTAPKIYSVVVFKKSSQYTKKLLTLENQKSFFLAENDSWLKRVLTRYNLFTMLDNPPQGFSWKKPYLANDETLLINVAGRQVVTTENHQTFYVTTETPTLILDVLEELDRLIQKDNVKTNAKEDDVKAFKLRFQRKWFAILATVALIKLCHKLDKAFDSGKFVYVNIDGKGNIGEHEDALLNFDMHPVNMNIFSLVQTEVSTPAKMYEVPIKHSGISRASRKATSTLRFIVFNTGDSLASSHYYSGKGVFYGRRASDSAANEILKYNQSFQNGKDNLKDRNTLLMTALNTDLKGVRTQIIDSGSQYVDPISKDQKNEISIKLLLELVNAEKAKCDQNNSKPLGEFDYRVESRKNTSSNANKFTVRMNNGDSFEGEIIKEPFLKIGNIKYETFIEAVLSKSNKHF